MPERPLAGRARAPAARQRASWGSSRRDRRGHRCRCQRPTAASDETGIGLVSLLILRSHGFPQRLAHLGLVATALLLIIYFGRMVVYNPKSPGLLAAALITGFVVNPAWYTWLGLRLWRPSRG